VFGFWLERLKEAFVAEGVDAEIISIQNEAHIPLNESCATLGFNLIRTWSKETPSHPHLIWMVDPPAYHGVFFAHGLTGMPVTPDSCFVGCVDTGWMSFAKQVYNFKNLFFLPHATSVKEPHSPGTARKYDAVFLGSLQSPEALLTQLRNKAANNWPIIQAMIDQSGHPRFPSLDQMMINTVQALNLPPEKAWVFINVFYPLIDSYIRNNARVKLLSSIETGRVHVFGQGDWDKTDWPENIILHDAVPFSRIFDLLRQTKILVNHSPSHQGGAHERIFDALMCGASVLTTPSAFVSDTFANNACIQTYGQPSEINIHLSNMLNIPSLDQETARAQATILQAHTMTHRAREILRHFA